MDHNKPKDNTEKSQLLQQIKIIQLVRVDLQKAVEFHDKLFIKWVYHIVQLLNIFVFHEIIRMERIQVSDLL